MLRDVPPSGAHRLGMFQRAPTLGGECYARAFRQKRIERWFQRAPTLGGECYILTKTTIAAPTNMFQRAPTLGGECYCFVALRRANACAACFNGHPPLGVNATNCLGMSWRQNTSFNGHPPLGVNATGCEYVVCACVVAFQRAPTLGGECYRRSLIKFNLNFGVSTGTHPWG